MKSIVRGGGLVIGAALLLGGCGSFGGKGENGPASSAAPAPTSDLAVDTHPKLGDPYTIGGVTYTPADVADYDDVGYASWYGDELAGKPTANGEIFNPDAISAAHRTLPLPSYVEVTALDTGRTILVRINDRGPMAGNRLIDLSRAAAQQLGIADGPAAVRVRRTNPPMAERAQLRAGKPVPERITTPDSLLAILRNKLKSVSISRNAVESTPVTVQPAPPVASGAAKPGDDRIAVGDGKSAPKKPEAKPAPTKPAPATKAATKPAQAAGPYAVQVGAFSSETNASSAAKSVGGSIVKTGKLWRVRMGPFATDGDAKAALDKAKAKGFRDAAVIRDR